MDSGRAAARRPGMTADDYALAGGAVPWDHFSILPSTPQAVSPRKMGRAKPLSPAAGVSSARTGASAVEVDACVSNGVATAPRRPSAVFLPLSRLPMVWPSAPLT